jgi:hypothetical protein
MRLKQKIKSQQKNQQLIPTKILKKNKKLQQIFKSFLNRLLGHSTKKKQQPINLKISRYITIREENLLNKLLIKNLMIKQKRIFMKIK